MSEAAVPSTMRAAVVRAIGEAPRCEKFAEPVAGEGEALVQVRAASLKPIDKQLVNGAHFAASREVPFVCGIDGVGTLSDGQRVFFGGVRAPFGAMAERAVAQRAFCFPVPDGMDDMTAAALPNPGVSAWLALGYRAKAAAGENILILGATGVTGKLAVRIAKLLGARRVVAAGRNREALSRLRELGADATICLDAPAEELVAEFAREIGASGFQVVIDYLWGRPTEIFLEAITRKEFAVARAETRLVQVGESAGAAISLPAAVLRSTALTILGTAGMPPRDVLVEALQKVMALGAVGELGVETERVTLADIENIWNRDQRGRRFVVIP